MHNRRIISTICILAITVLILVFTGCATVKTNDFNVDSPSEKIPMRVGLYMGPGFRNLVYKAGSYSFPLSEEMKAGVAAGAERALGQTFQEVFIIDQSESTGLAKYGVKAIVTPEIVEPGISMRERGGFWAEGEFEFVCKWTVYSTDGKVLYMNTFKGTGRDSSFAGTTRFNKGITLAAKDSFEKFISHVLSTKWWEPQNFKGAK